MANTTSSTSDPSVRFGWLKGMYWANILISGPIGAGAILAPDAFQTLMGLPPQDPVHFGIASGAVPLAFGLAGLWGLQAPLKTSAVLLLQVCYKVLFLAGVALPLMLSGAFPRHALPIVAIYTFFIVGNSVAIPFRYLLKSSVPSQAP